MAAQPRSTRVPSWVPFFNPIARLLLAAGVPMGPDVLITVRGRKSGLPRTTPVTICENSGRRGLISPFGEVNWVRNLRAARRATITVGRRHEEVTAVELSPVEAATFIRDVLAPHARRTRLGSWFVRHVDRIDIDHPAEAAEGRPVFELHPVRRNGRQEGRSLNETAILAIEQGLGGGEASEEGWLALGAVLEEPPTRRYDADERRRRWNRLRPGARGLQEDLDWVRGER